MSAWVRGLAMGLCIASTGLGQDRPTIASMSTNGEITWTDTAMAPAYRVEWASAPCGPWLSSWASLDYIVRQPESPMRARVPVFFRVVRLTAADALQQPVVLAPPYAPPYPGAPTDRISVQYAVIAVVNQVGLRYDWNVSYANTAPTCRTWTTPSISGASCQAALEGMLAPLGLGYEIRDETTVVLVRL